eukprot:7104879-Pyramimonas_sp.AAC.1
MMLLGQALNAAGDWRRQLWRDASPQKGIELFSVREFAHQRADVTRAQFRTLPVCTPGVGHFTASDKAVAVLHCIGLESGFRAAL